MSDQKTQGAEAESKVNEQDHGESGRNPAYLERELKRVIGQREATEAKLKEFEAKQEEAIRARLVETQKWEEAYNKEVPVLKTELETYKTKYMAFEEKLTARVKSKEETLSKEAREEYDKYISKLPLEDRDDWLNAKSSPTPTASPASTRTGVYSGTQKPVNAMSPEERITAFLNNPTGFAKSIAG